MAAKENSINTSGMSSHDDSVLLENSDSLILQDDWSGISKSDLELEIIDPFHDMFYHLMPSKEDTTFLFYNQMLYNRLLAVLSKQFKFPPEDTQTFTIKMHSKDKKVCLLHIDKRIKSIRASGPGHSHWKETNFRTIAENLFRWYVKDTNAKLNSSNSAENQVNESLSASQASTQPNQSGTNYTPTEGTEEGPSVIIDQQQVDTTRLQDRPVIHHITVLIDMIHKQQRILTNLTRQVNQLIERAVDDSLYRTVDEVSSGTVQQSEVFEDPFPPLPQQNNGNANVEQEQTHEVSATTCVDGPVSSNEMNTDGLPSPSVQLPDLQTRAYNEVARTSTPKTPQRPSAAPRQTRPPQNPRQMSQSNTTKEILLIGDSLISSINVKGLKQNIYKHGIPGGKIEHVLSHMKVYDLKQFSSVIVYVGGNDAANGTDPELFEEKYDQLIRHIKAGNNQCQIFICNMCPRGDTSTTEINDMVKSLSDENQIVMIDADKLFHDSHDNVIRRYYDSDSIHLSSSGIKRLLNAINNQVPVVQDFENCVPNRRHQRKSRHGSSGVQRQHKSRRSDFRARRDADQDETTNFCYKCGESNHDTNSCRHKQQLKCFQCGFMGHKSGRCLQK